ncbi:MAG: class I SAM-dependent methyltransferase, partial [Pseudomonadota bacterium]
HAIDISPRMIEIAEGKTRDAGIDNITYERADMDTLMAPEESYDVALGMSILHLVDDRDSVIEKVHTMLRPGGVFVSSTVCMAEGYGIFRYIGPVGFALGLLPRLRVFSKVELEASIRAAGFEIEESWKQDSSPAAFIVARKV